MPNDDQAEKAALKNSMDFSDFLESYAPYNDIVNNLSNTPISVSGITESAQSQLAYALCKRSGANCLAVFYTDMEAKEFYSDLLLYTDKADFFPSREYVFYNIASAARLDENERLAAVYDAFSSGGNIIVTSVDALLQYTVDDEIFKQSIITFVTGKQFDLEKLSVDFVKIGYTREELVEGKGQFAVRGGIIDIFPPNSANPYRIEFFDDEVDSIREFDPLTQRSLTKTDRADIIPATEAIMSDERLENVIAALEKRIKTEKRSKNKNDEYIKMLETDIDNFRESRYFPSIDKYVSLIYDKIPSLIDYFADDDIVLLSDPSRICERGRTFERETGEIITELKERNVISHNKDEYFGSFPECVKKLSQKKLIALESLSHTKNNFSYRHLTDFVTRTTISFHGKIEYLYDSLTKWQKDGYTVIILVSTRGRGENITGVLNDRKIRARLDFENGGFKKGETVVMRGSLNKGFEYPDYRFVVISDREIFESKNKRRQRKIENAEKLKSYNDINPGDYVVHSTHGIGKYVGTARMKANGVIKDYLKISYRGTDVLYVPIDQLNGLYKYASNETDNAPKLNKLSGSDWNNTTQRVKKATAELADELIKLYAQRASVKGFAFSADTEWQREFEDTFEYNETDDQLTAIEEVKSDMEKPKPMDRLLCGDVGFGKTEVALRAAFKAVSDSKQVVYLCPTTVLAMQHYETFLSRMRNFPIKVEMLSRFRSAAQQKKIIKQLRTGEIDVVIGTHRLLSDDVRFHDLGLLVIDEEQRFGVKHKEKIKELKQNIDVLTMTATPIPRTLHMAMTSVRDMSVLTEPPENRYPVQTYVFEENKPLLQDAIRNEVQRGGQVFYLFNRVRGIYAKAEELQAAFPNFRIKVGHGKMPEDELEEIMYDMSKGNIDVLVCTTIIETGLDIPNANTIIIENADKMGLAQLYQLRGRVGRSNRTAYAYMTYRRDSILTEVASKRLRAIKDFTEFGSGFKIAMRDLEIRGAGNILGSQQHGHMDSVGYDMYCQILNESIRKAQGITDTDNITVSIDIDMNAYLPESYIPDASQRIDIYKEIAAIGSEEDKFEIEDELIDRFGDIPREVQNIVNISALRIIAKPCGICDISQKGDILRIEFAENRIDAELVFAIEKKYPDIRIDASGKPAINFRIKGNDILNFTEKILKSISEIRGIDKK